MTKKPKAAKVVKAWKRWGVFRNGALYAADYVDFESAARSAKHMSKISDRNAIWAARRITITLA